MTSVVPDLTSRQVAEQVGVDRGTVRRWAHQGRLRAVKLPSGVTRYYQDDVDAILATADEPGEAATS